ncbi:hypothetical protein CCZ27_15480 [Thauera sinica]|nr:hypothetical protein CCZ27_15480 [Thauera sp. K11]
MKACRSDGMSGTGRQHSGPATEVSTKESNIMEAIERTRTHDRTPAGRVAGEIERLRAQNAALLAAIASANAAMTAAPSWHEMHRTAQKVLRAALAEAGAAQRPQTPVRRVG